MKPFKSFFSQFKGNLVLPWEDVAYCVALTMLLAIAFLLARKLLHSMEQDQKKQVANRFNHKAGRYYGKR
jgi:hypothetical protein